MLDQLEKKVNKVLSDQLEKKVNKVIKVNKEYKVLLVQEELAQ